MTIFDLVLLVNRLTWLVTLALLFGCAFLSLALISRAWVKFRDAIYDCIAIYGSFQAARFDAADLPEKARVLREQTRAQLAAGQAAMWKAGVFDVEIDDRRETER